MSREPSGLTCRGDSLALSGCLDAASVPALWRFSEQKLSQCVGREVSMDLTAVDRVDSAGLALLVAWVRLAKKRQVTIRFLNAPRQLLALASANRLEHLAFMLGDAGERDAARA
ncbi:MAG: STAS domain-containing protein [Pseudomonadota bacterium]|nr:STAS domain-containing protein [Pseudomonadota bacterium]